MIHNRNINSNMTSSSSLPQTLVPSVLSQQPIRTTKRGHGRVGAACTILFILGFIVTINIGLVWIAGTLLASTPQGDNNHVPHQHVVDVSQQQGRPQQSRSQKYREPTMPPRESSTNTAGFIHVGKTAGSTISLLLRNGCTSFKKGPCRNIAHESAVSKYVEHYYHVPDFFRLPTTNHEAYIISVRDVYDRTVSAFLYHHPKNIQVHDIGQSEQQKYQNEWAYQCFPTLQEFAMLAQGKQHDTECNYPHRHNVVETSDCGALACAVLHGKVRKFQHLFFNYRNILYTKMPQGRKVYALRQENLWDDWTDLNVMLGQPKEEVVIPSQNQNLRNVTGLKLPVSRNINPEAKNMLCRSLEEEYVAYFKILKRSININDQDMQQSKLMATQNCPNLDIESMVL